jgi:hypothetical protein
MGGDSNPWCLAAHTLSWRAQSTALSSIRTQTHALALNPCRLLIIKADYRPSPGVSDTHAPFDKFAADLPVAIVTPALAHNPAHARQWNQTRLTNNGALDGRPPQIRRSQRSTMTRMPKTL